MGPSSTTATSVPTLFLISIAATTVMTACGKEEPLVAPPGTGPEASVRGPKTEKDAYEIESGESLNVSASSDHLLSNDDLGHPTSTLISFGGGALGEAASDHAAGATVAPIPGFVDGSLHIAADGSFDFVAPGGFGGDFPFAYTLANSVDAAEGSATITVNTPPFAVNDTYLSATTTNGTGLVFEQILNNDNMGHPYGVLTSFGAGTMGGDVTDHEAGSTVSPVPGFPDGVIRVSAAGRVELTPPTGIEGDFVFEYVITNSLGSSVGHVLVDLTAQPQATDDEFVIGINRRIHIREGHDGLMKNDDLGMPAGSLVSFGGGTLGGGVADHAAGTTIAPLPGFESGLLTINADGTFEFEPPTGFTGEVTFEYMVENSEGTSTALVTISVMRPRLPNAVNDEYVTTESTALAVAAGTGGLLDNDDLGYPVGSLTAIGGGHLLAGGTDYDDGELVSPIPGFPDGSLIAYPDGSFDFTPPTGFLGEFMFDYELRNSLGYVEAWVTVIVEEMPVLPPVAVDDAYTASGNVPIELAADGGVILGAGTDQPFGGVVSEVNADPANVGVPTPTTAVGRDGVTGFVTLNPDGSFTYDPPPGFTDGDDAFAYRLSNAAGTSELATVTISISDLVWFIDNSATAGPGAGAFSNPFASIAEFNAANGASGAAPDPRDGDAISLMTGTGTYAEADGINLRAGQRLNGAATPLTRIFNADANSSAAYGTFAAGVGPAPVVETSGAAANGIELSSDNTVTGLNIGNTAGYGLSGDAVGTLTINTVSVNGNGGALRISTSGNLSNVAFDDLSSTGSAANGIDLTGATGSLTILAATGISNSAGSSIAIAGGEVTFAYPGPIEQSSDASTVIVTGGHSGRLTFQGPVSATAGDGLQFSNADGLYTFNGPTVLNGGDAGIDIVSGSEGLFVFADASITNPLGIAFNVDGSSPQVDYVGSISHNANHTVRINGVPSSGPVNFSGGAIADNGLGILLTGNAGTEITFSSDLILNTNGGTAFSALDGGTVNVTGTNNVVTTTNAIAVQFDNTTIGLSGVTFATISSDGGAKGIVLNNAGGGGFTVTGAGSTVASGGTIQNKTDRAIEIVNTDNVSFANIVLNNASTTDGPTCTALDNSGCHAAIHLDGVTGVTFTNVQIGGTTVQQGINGLNVSDLTLDGSTITGAGNEANEGGVRLFNLSGTAIVSNSTIEGSAERNVLVMNDFTDGTSLNLTVSSSTIQGTQASAFGADGLEIEIQGTSQLDMTVDASLFLANRTNGIQVIVADNAVANTINITGNTFDPGTGIGAGIDLAANNSGEMNFNIIGNPVIYSDGGTAVNVRGFVNAVVQGRITNNSDIQTDRTLGGAAGGNGISVGAEEQAVVTVEIDNNLISNIFQDVGIRTFSRARVAGTAGTLDATVTNNTVVLQGDAAFPLYGIEVRAEDTNTTCANVANNAVTIGSGLAVFSERTALGATVLLQGFAVDAANTWTANGNTPTVPVDASNDGTLGGGTCTTVSIPLP